MASSNIADPFVLATYTSSSRVGKLPQKYAPGVFASVHKRSEDEYVTVAAQGDGLHVLDVADLHPIISHTLGPSTAFSCPPLTLPSSSKHCSTTFAVIAASTDLASPEDAGRTIWMWDDNMTLKERQKVKQTRTIFSKGQTIHGLYPCYDVPGRIVAISSTGDICLLDAELLEVKTTTTPDSPLTVLHAWVSSRSLIPGLSGGQNGAYVMVISAGSSTSTHLRLLAIDEADSIAQIQAHEIPINSDTVVAASWSTSAILSVLTHDGAWVAYQISSSSPPELLSAPLHLSNYTFSPSNSMAVSLLSLSSSYVFLSAISSHEIVLQIWDLRFSVILASQTLPIPSALASSALHIRLLPSFQSSSKAQPLLLQQAILIISSIPPLAKQAEGQKTSTSVLLVVPYSVPSVSTIAAAMGRGAASKKWLKAATIPSDEAKTSESAEETARKVVLAAMRAAIHSGRAQAAEAAFLKWASTGEDGPINLESASRTSTTLEYNFVKEVLEVVLLPPADAQTAAAKLAYASEVVRYLLERGVVCSAMITLPGGLLGALRARGDWKSIETSFDKVSDLTETEIVETLRVVIAHHRHALQKSSSDAMQVDTPTNTQVTSLPLYLNLLATYPTSRGPLLLSFRRYLQDAEDLTVVLTVLDGWIAKRVKAEERLLPTKKDLKKTEHGVWVVVGRRKDRDGKKERRREDTPPLEKIINLLQTLLDASFLSLLPHKPAHKILLELSELVKPEIANVREAEALRAPLEVFKLAQEKALKDSLVSKEDMDKERQKGDWRQRRKVDNGEIGVYALEELGL